MNQEQVTHWLANTSAEGMRQLVANASDGALVQVVFAPFDFDVLTLNDAADAARKAGLSVCFVALDNEIVGIGFQKKYPECVDFDGMIVGVRIDTSILDADINAAVMRKRGRVLDKQTAAFVARYGFSP